MSRYDGSKGPPNIEGMTSLKVDNLTYRTTIEDLDRYFRKYGDVGDIYIPRDSNTHESRGFAFVRFHEERDADDAMDGMDGKVIDGREIRVAAAQYGRPSNQFNPRRDGGGGGGRHRGRSYGGGSGYGRDRDRYNDRRRSPRRYSPRRPRSRSRSHSPRRRSRSLSRSPRYHKRSPSRSPVRSPLRNSSRSPLRNASRSPLRNASRSPLRNSRSPVRRSVSRSRSKS